MAGLPWFTVAADFPEHPKTVRLCARLKDQNAGMHAVRLMSYCSRYAPTGRIEADMVEHAAAGLKRVAGLVDALVEAGFLEPSGDSAFLFHGWEERNGAHARKAEKDAKKPRGNRPRPPAVPPLSPEGPAGDESGTGAGPSLESERERDKETEKITVASDPPSAPDPSRPQRWGVGHPGFEAGEHWLSTVWPSISNAPTSLTTRQASMLGALCGRLGPAEVKARMDRAAGDAYWRERLTLDVILDNPDRFAARKPAAGGKGPQPVSTDFSEAF